MSASADSTEHDDGVLRVATYNIHKGVQGIGPTRRLEIHNLALAVDTLDADIVCLQEVRMVNRREADFFSLWPQVPQAEFLAPEGYEAVYSTNAVTKHGEHGNALLSRWPIIKHCHEDMSDHRFEQRGLLHVEILIGEVPLHAIVVHFGLIPASRLRQTAQLQRYIAREVPIDAPVIVAGDFNDWGTQVKKLLRAEALHSFEGPRTFTYPSRLPVVQLDHIYARGMEPLGLAAPRGRAWSRMSDHLPLIAEFRMRAGA
ncbi:endonuclease/exonuclease/phosphatase family protein [Ottowia thiooxydans]|uniref:endonuclease/exonuclease/phosphatase family protein n=1 Tax=Ottowia thiooxydans TaxID=219182 RepID=UPI00040D8875|nr:endonuclease/exonuclease/phosphatase family protein [Ottowia thiooxydans]